MRTWFSRSALLLLTVLIVPILAACGGAPAAQQPQIQTVVVTTAPQVVTTAPQVVTATPDPNATAEPTVAAAPEAFTTPHPILGDVRVRQAIAYCTNRLELIQSVYSFLPPEQQSGLLMDTFLPTSHWAHATEGITTYPFDPAQGGALLDEAGWTLAEGASIRTNAAGETLSLEFTTTNAPFRVTWATVMEQQLLANCGIQIVRKHAPASWWFGDTTGLARRDFELGAFAWVGQADPGGQTLYACNQIPLPSNNWAGQNSMGWCNEAASKAIIAANNTLDRNERIRQYAIVQQEFTKDMVSLPLFNRLEAEAANLNLVNFKPNPTEYVTANAFEWELSDGGTEIVIGSTQEPASMWSLVESAAIQRTLAYLISALAVTTYDYDYQPVTLKQLATIENGKATNADVDVNAGDLVWTTSGERVELAPGVEVTDATGATVVYESGTVKMKQLTATYEFVEGVKWEDGELVKKADYELGYKIDCDRESGATSFITCDSIQNVSFDSDTAYTVTYLPGVQNPTYFLPPIGAYPSHQVIQSEGPFNGQKLADVPAKSWATLPEIAERPLSTGPFRLVEWQKGQRMVFEANPNYYLGAPKIQRITFLVIADGNQAVAQLLTGDVDILGSETLGAGAEAEAVFKAAAEGRVQAIGVASPTWEHVDFNLFVR